MRQGDRRDRAGRHCQSRQSQRQRAPAQRRLAQPRPLVDEATLSVLWRGQALHLGHSKGFWVLARLARRVNQYVTHSDLLQEIWDDEFADTERLRAGMKRLRGKLRQGGMADLADAITGHHGRYMLDLAGAKCHREVPVVSRRTSQP